MFTKKQKLQEQITILLERMNCIQNSIKLRSHDISDIFSQIDKIQRIIKYSKEGKPTVRFEKHDDIYEEVFDDIWTYDLYVYVDKEECIINGIKLPKNLKLGSGAAKMCDKDNVSITAITEECTELEIIVGYKEGNYVIKKRVHKIG